MARIARLPSIALAMLTGLAVSQQAAFADPGGDFGWDVRFCDPGTFTYGDVAATCTSTTAAGTAPGTPPTFVAEVEVQASGGPSSHAPLIDRMLIVVGGLDGSYGSTPIGAFTGEIALSSRSNLNTSATNNIDPTTGAPPACDAAGTTPVAPLPARLLNATTGPAQAPVMTAALFDFEQYVQSFDDDDGDLHEFLTPFDAEDGGDALPETQEDGDGNGLPDGAERMPDFLPRYLNANGFESFLARRQYGVLELAPGSWQIDVNVITLDLRPAGGEEIDIVLFGRHEPSRGSGVGSVVSVLCPPATVALTQYGVAQANGGVAGGDVLRTNTTGTHPALVATTTRPDEDEDGVPAVLDRCPADAASGAADSDGDGLGDACDPAPGSADNDGGGLVVNTSPPWSGDQDVDHDGWHNFMDNCPLVANTTQWDANLSGVGDDYECAAAEPLAACADALNSDGDVRTNDGCPLQGGDAEVLDDCDSDANDDPGDDGYVNDGCPATLASETVLDWRCFGCVDSFGHHHTFNCEDGVTYGSAEPDGDPVVCHNGSDSDHDFVDDWNPSSANIWGSSGTGELDVNSDTDADGCSDGAEAFATANGGSLPCLGDPLDPDSDGDGVIDGAEDTDGNGIADWRDDVATYASADAGRNHSGSPDSDGDGCSNFEEAGSNQLLGGNRNALYPWDFVDVPTPAVTSAGMYPTTSVQSTRDRVITLSDVLVALEFAGSPPTYFEDGNDDNIPDGIQVDRTPATAIHLVSPPNFSSTLQDTLIVLSHFGASCIALP